MGSAVSWSMVQEIIPQWLYWKLELMQVIVMGFNPQLTHLFEDYNLLENRVSIYGAWTHNRAMQNNVRCLSEPVPRGHSSLSPMRPQCLGGIVLCEHMLSDSLVTVWPSGQVDCSHRVRYVFMEILPPDIKGRQWGWTLYLWWWKACQTRHHRQWL